MLHVQFPILGIFKRIADYLRIFTLYKVFGKILEFLRLIFVMFSFKREYFLLIDLKLEILLLVFRQRPFFFCFELNLTYFMGQNNLDFSGIFTGKLHFIGLLCVFLGTFDILE